MRKRFRRIMLKLHLYTGLTLGLYLTVMGITGSLLVYKHEIASLMNPGLHHVEGEGLSRRPMSKTIEAFRTEYPEAEIARIYLPRHANESMTFWVGPWQGDQQRVYVDPYRASVQGERAYTATIMGWVEYLHYALLAGRVGFVVNAILGLATLVLLATGLVLWWPRNAKLLLQRIWIKWSAPAKRINWDAHNAIGVWSLPLLTLLCITGAAFTFPGQIEAAARYVLREPKPPAPAAYVAPVDMTPLPIDELIDAGLAAMPGSKPALLTSIEAEDRPLSLYVHPEGDEFGAWWIGISIDRYTGEVLSIDSPDTSTTDLLMAIVFPLHAGMLGGQLMKAIWFVSGLTPAALMATGVVMWLVRTRALERRKTGRNAPESAGSDQPRGSDHPGRLSAAAATAATETSADRLG